MKVLIYGTGVMGKGIAQVLASNGVDVLLYNQKYERAEMALLKLETDLKRLVEKEKITIDEYTIVIRNVKIINNLSSAFDVDLVIEAVPENLDIKKKVIEIIDKNINENAIIATNTSSLSISDIALSTTRSSKVIGMHFFNPAPIMNLIEIIRGNDTSDSTVDSIVNLAKTIKKEFIVIKEAPGFVVNRILIPFINDAIGVLNEGIASPIEIDKAIKLGANHPIGPLALADLIGLDVCLNIMNTLYSKLGDSKYKPNPLLEEMVGKNLLGRKTKVGFYTYWGKYER